MSLSLTPEESEAILHHVQYGVSNTRNPRGAKRATSSSWGEIGEFTEPRTVTWDILVVKEHIPNLIRGFIPQEMEEKWFIYSEDIMEDEGEETEWRETRLSGFRACFHRSWTGNKIAEIEVELSKQLDENGLAGARVKSITFNAEAEEEDLKSMIIEVCNWVLGVTLRSDIGEAAVDQD